MSITLDEIEKWEVEEVQYIEELGYEPEGQVHVMAYIELLQEYCNTKCLCPAIPLYTVY